MDVRVMTAPGESTGQPLTQEDGTTEAAPKDLFAAVEVADSEIQIPKDDGDRWEEIAHRRASYCLMLFCAGAIGWVLYLGKLFGW